MAGKRGRSGRISTPEQARQNADAGLKGAAVRWGELRGKEPVALTPEQERAAADAAPGLGRPLSWREAWQRQQAAVAALRGRLLKIELETAERDRIPIDEVRAFCRSLRDIVLREFATLPALADQLPEGREHQINWLRERLLEFAAQVRTNVSKQDII